MTRARKNRRGAAVLELSLVLGAFAWLTLGMLDLGIGVFRYHILANAARQGARRAIVHGKRAAALGPWGPDSIDVFATADKAIVDGVRTDGGSPDGLRPLLVGCDKANTRIQVVWLDSSNALGKKVQVTVTSPYKPFILLFLPGTLNLTAVSTMQIAH